MEQGAEHHCQQTTENRQLPPQCGSSDLWSDRILASWMSRDPTADSLDQWIYWNNSPLRNVSEEVVTSFFPSSFCPIFLSDSRVTAHVDTLLRSKLSWNDDVSWSPSDPLWDLAMISSRRLRRLALLSASFSMQHAITQIIDGTIVRQLRKQLGDDIFQFVLLSNTSTKYFLEPMNRELSALDNIVEAINQGAITMIEQAFSSKTHGIQRRIATKLSGCFVQGYYDAPLPWALLAEQILSTLWKEVGSWL